MATAAVSIVDRLIQLATVRERNRERFFNNFIEPLYRDGEQIAKDYLAILAELRQRIAQAKKSEEIADWLEQKRATFQPVRTKIRALIEEGSLTRKDHGHDKDLALFRKGLWGLMKGGVSMLEDGHAWTREYGFGGHTVLDLLRHAQRAALQPEFRDELSGQAQEQQQAIELAWADVAKAYAALRSVHLK